MHPLDPEVTALQPGAMSLQQLCTCARQELLMHGYSRRTLNRYELVWRRLMEFAREQVPDEKYSRSLALSFEQAYGLRDGEAPKRTEPWRRHVGFALKILDDYVRTGGIVRFVVEASGLRVPHAMQKPLRGYEQYLRERRHLRRSSLKERMHAIAVFIDFLRSREVTTFDQMKTEHISAYIVSRSHWKPKTVACATRTVKLFLRFLFLQDVVPRDFSPAVPRIRVASNATVPSVWDSGLVTQLLQVVDRNSPKGKRDYAMLVLAARLGLRIGDIRALRLDDLHWERATIEVAQGKTSTPLILPMSEEVGSALIDYLKSARPPCQHREVFLCLKPPFEPFSGNNHLHHIIQHWRQAAGIEFRTKQRQGFHSLRHTLATRLLHEQTPFHVISEILGHASTSSTFIYAKANVETLRSAALNTEEMHHVH